jgi:transcriptional regulator of arginine metabolism
MKHSRQNKILEIISAHEIDTQKTLAKMLGDSGFSVTQATISRDIKELQLVKSMTAGGGYKYAAGGGASHPSADRFVKIFRETIQSVACSGNIIVVKTLPGCANAACESIDSLNLPKVLGTLAGDNTLFMVVNDKSDVPAIMDRFNEMAK